MIHAPSFLENDLSPVPVATVVLGFWFPLEWLVKGSNLLHGLTFPELVHALAASALVYFIPAGMALVACVYLMGLAAFALKRPYGQIVKSLMHFTADLMAVVVVLVVIKVLTVGQATVPVGLKAVIAFLAIGMVCLLASRGIRLVKQMQVSRWVAVLAVLLALAGSIHEISVQFQKRPIQIPASGHQQDIILITLDALSSRNLSCYGYSRQTSPRMDTFAEDAILFSQFYANANWTRPGVASLLNGTRPWAHAADLGPALGSVTSGQNLLGCLAKAGYEIRTISTNAYADHAYQRTPTGCSEQYLFVDNLLFPAITAWLPSLSMVSNVGPVVYLRFFHSLLEHGVPGDRLGLPVAKAEEILGRPRGARPLFLWVHLIPPHDPYAAPAPFLGMFDPSPLARTRQGSDGDFHFTAGRNAGRQALLRARYDEAVRYADDGVGRILERLKAQGRFDGSLIILSADHGEAFSHGYGLHGGPLLLEDLLRIPLLIKPPGHHGRVREDAPFEQADLAPTVLRFAGLPIPKGMEGEPYPVKPEGRPVFAMNRDITATSSTFSIAMRQGPWKYVVHLGKWTFPWPQRELYDLERDPDETMNLAERRPDLCAPMHAAILAELSRHGLKPEGP